jgi:hypothetical protein
MASPRVRTGSVVQESDYLQAAYFRAALTDERALLSANCVRQNKKLQAMAVAGASAFAITRLRRQIREIEIEIRQLDRMIEAIDLRFSPR